MRPFPPLLLLATTFTLALSAAAAAPPAPPAWPHRDPAVERKVDALVARMTVDEKVGQLNQIADRKATGPVDYKDPGTEGRTALIKQGKVGSILNATGAAFINAYQRAAVQDSRLQIPVLFGFDVIHGYETIFPIPLAQAASWDLEAIARAEEVAAREASAAGIRWTFAPMVDVARDARWGRIMEGAGEDPYLGAAIAAARVRGFQGEDPSRPDRVLACAKHFAAYGFPTAGRDYVGADVSERTLREVIFPPFRAALDAGVATFMTSFNEIGGVPATGSRFLFHDVLRGEWGFRGFVVADWKAIDQLRPHGTAATRADAARAAFDAGVEMDMVDDVYAQELPALRKSGDVTTRALDEAVRRVLRVKFAAGLFDHPYTDEARAPREMRSPEHRAAARELARKSMVLLRNEKELLPLGKDVRTLAVLGPLADSKEDPLGAWAAKGSAEHVTSVLEGIRRKLSVGTKVLHAVGTDGAGKDGAQIPAAVALAKQADAVVLVVGEPRDFSGEAKSRTELDLPGAQKELVRAVVKTGKPVVLVLMNGRPLALPWEAANVPAILEAWFLGTETGGAVADVLFGDASPSGKLPVSFPRAVGQVPIHYAEKNTGRPFTPEATTPFTSRYLDAPNTPLYPFGFGLSYTKYAYSNLRVTPASMPPGGQVIVEVDVQNVGRRPGEEIAQLYVRDVVGSTTRPIKELRGFSRVLLAPGEKKTVRFTLGPKELAVLDAKWRPVVEPGTFKVWAGPSSVEGLEGTLEVVVAGRGKAAR